MARFRIHTDRMRMESEYRVILKNLFALEDLPPPRTALLASVVPPVEREMKGAIERLFGVEARVVEAADTGLEVLIDNPKEAGADRLVNAVGALAYPSPTGRYIVVDFGTATTLDLVEAPNRYLGGAITIGPQTAADALAARTAKLPRIDLVPPKRAVGKNTLEALRSGLVLAMPPWWKAWCAASRKRRERPWSSPPGASPKPLGPSAPPLTWWTRT